MNNKKYTVRLSDEERDVCQEVVKRLKGTSEKFKRARILLKADADGLGWSDVKIAEAYDCRVQTVETDRKTLSNGMARRKIEHWVIPPNQDAEFVACMKDVLDTYENTYNPKQPVLCMDEQSVQLLKETHVPIAATK